MRASIVGGSTTPRTRRRASRGYTVTTVVPEKLPERPDGTPIMARSARQFEYDVRRVVRRHLARDMKGIRVLGPIVKVGLSGTRHEFDLWYSFQLGHIEHHVVWEARCRSRPVSKEQVAAFIGKIADLSERPKGAICSISGFQVGAKKLALANGIGLYRLEGFRSRRPVIMLENPAVTIHSEFFHVRLIPSLSMAFVDMTEQILDQSPRPPPRP